MNKKNLAKVTGTSAAAFLIAGTTAFTAFAAMPEGTVVIGNKAFSLEYANLEANVKEIREAVVAGGEIYVKAPNGTWYNNASEVLADASAIPAVEFKAADGTVTNYAAKDGEVASAGLKVNSVSAIKVNKLEVTFSNAIDTADVTVAVTKGASAVEATVAWNAEKTVATITTTAKMTNGVYTVTAKSTANATSSTGTTEVKSQYVKEIKLLNNIALTGSSDPLKDNADRAYIYYDVLDQYGESLRTSTNVEWSFSAAKVTDNRTTGMLTVKRPDDKAFTYGEKIYVTGVYTKTGVTVTNTVEVGAKQALNSVEVAGFVKKGTSEIVKTLPSGFKADTYYMVYNVKDQNGNAMIANTPLASNDVTFVSDNVLLVKELTSAGETTLTIDGKEYNAVIVTPGINVGKGGEVNITAIANKTGNKTALNTVIGEDHILTSFAMSAPSNMIADGEKVEIPFEALDQNGDKITNFVTLAKQATFNKLTFTTSAGQLKLSENNDGTAKLEYIDDAFAWTDAQTTDGIDRTISLTSVVVGGDTSGQLIYIQDKARPDAISAVDMDNVLVEQGSDKITLSSFDFLDQYGRKMAGVLGYASAAKDGNNENKNKGYIYDNGFFAASKAGSLKGTDFAGYEFIVRASFKGDATYLTDNGVDLITTTSSGIEISTDLGLTDLDLTANEKVVEAAKSGFSIKYEIAKYKAVGETLADAQATSTAKSEAVTVVDIKSVKGYTVADLNKFYIATLKNNDVTGDAGAIALAGNTTTSAGIYANIVAADLVGGVTLQTDYDQEVTVTGTYNGETVTVPAVYFTIDAAKLADTNNDGTIESAKLNNATNALKWSDFYDATTARFVRKDATDTIKVTVNDLDKGGVIDTVAKAVTIADAAPKAASITGVDTLTIKPTTTAIAAPTYLDGVIKAEAVNKYYVKDQYGVTLKGLTLSYKVASIEANAAGYADNNFTVSGNDTSAAAITGAERGDTYVLTIKAGNVTKDIKVTVGADTNANINSSTNNYLDVLIGDGLAGYALEEQRANGLK